MDDQLRTNVNHIYAAGDVVGGHQFTYLAGWQAFQAVRNALLPGYSSGFTGVVRWVTFTDPEVAHVGLTSRIITCPSMTLRHSGHIVRVSSKKT